MIGITCYDDLIARTGRRRFTVPHIPGETVAHLLANVGGLPAGDLVVMVGGVGIDVGVRGVTGVEDGDELTIAPRPGTIVDGILIAIAIASAAASAAMISKAKLPAGDDGTGAQEGRHGFGAIATEAFAGETVPVCLGTRPREGGKVIARIPVRSSDGSGDEKLRILICYGHGPIDAIGPHTADFDAQPAFAGLWFGEQPATSFAGVRCWGRLGSPGQAVIPGFADSELVRGVRGVGTGAGSALRNTSGSERTGADASGEAVLYTGVGDADSLTLNVRLASGLYRLAGQVESHEVEYRYRTRLSDDGGSPGAWSGWTTITVRQARQAAFYSSPRADFASTDRRDVQAERVSVENADAGYVDALTWESVGEVLRGPFAYAGHALLAVEVTASDQLAGVPEVSCAIRGVKVRVWDGVSPPSAPVFAEAFSVNPADLALEVATNTAWGLGRPDEAIDLAGLFEWRTRCAAMVPTSDGGERPRFACHLTMGEQREGVEWLGIICTTGWCRPMFAGELMRFAWDGPRAIAAEAFTDGSITVDDAGRLRMSISYEDGEGGRVRPNRFEAQVEGPDGRPDLVVFPYDGEEWLATEDPRPERVRLDGVTDLEQAWAHCVYMAKVERLRTRSISFIATSPWIAAQPWDRIDVSAGLGGWGVSGRLLAGSTAAVLILDRAATIDAGSYVKVLHDDGQAELATFAAVGTFAAGSELALAAPLSREPMEFAEYAVGGTLPEAKPFLVTEVALEDGEALVWRIGAVEYIEDVYDPDPAALGIPPYSNLSTARDPPAAVIDLVCFQRTINGLATLELAWGQRPADAAITGAFYIFRRILGAPAWVRVPVQSVSLRSAIIEIDEFDQAYQFAVVAVSRGGAHLPPDDPSHPICQVVLGLAEPPPPPPENPAITQEAGNTYTLSWDAVEDAVGYQVLTGGDTTSFPNTGAEDCLVLARTSDTELTGLELPPGVACRFWIRSIGENGRLSWSCAEVAIATPDTPAGESVKFSDDLDLDGTGTKVNTVWNAGRLELDDPDLPGTWTSPEVDTAGATLTEITFRAKTANDADDPILSDDPFALPSIAADQWGVTLGDLTVGMLMPPWPDEAQGWSFEVRTHDGGSWGAWEAIGVFESIRRTIEHYQVRVTMTRPAAPYRPALRGLTVVGTH